LPQTRGRTAGPGPLCGPSSTSRKKISPPFSLRAQWKTRPIYTQHLEAIHIIRKVVLRVGSYLNYLIPEAA